jgi:Na+-transporting methylmalonyl-CoA/oxaloacetate decarboxylase beta subunit
MVTPWKLILAQVSLISISYMNLINVLQCSLPFVLTTADLIRLRIVSRIRHIYDVGVLFDVTMHIYTGKF